MSKFNFSNHCPFSVNWALHVVSFVVADMFAKGTIYSRISGGSRILKKGVPVCT